MVKLTYLLLFFCLRSWAHPTLDGEFVKGLTQDLGTVNRPATLACLAPAGGRDDRARTWALANVQNIAAIPEANRGSLYHLIDSFYCRLTSWREYKPFYDELFARPEIAAAYPDALPPDRVDQGFFFRIRNPTEKISDNDVLRPLALKTVEELYGYAGDKRVFQHIPAIASRQLMVVPAIYFTPKITGTYNTAYHEFGHTLHLSLLSRAEYTQIEALYQQAKARPDGFLDDYAAGSSSEYIAQGLEAFMSETKPGVIGKYSTHTKEKLRTHDPGLYQFISQILESSGSENCSPQAP